MWNGINEESHREVLSLCCLIEQLKFNAHLPVKSTWTESDQDYYRCCQKVLMTTDEMEECYMNMCDLNESLEEGVAD